MINLIQQKIDECLNKKGKCILAIDGRCGAGKSSLGKQLKEIYDGELIHMDDFFLRPSQRSKERYATPGENVDHERFLKEVLLPIVNGKEFSYRKFDCVNMIMDDTPIWVKNRNVMIVEGSYSLHKELRNYYDIKIFLTIDKEEQLNRIMKRNPEKLEAFKERWIPLEELYFENEEVMKIADIVINVSNCNLS